MKGAIKGLAEETEQAGEAAAGHSFVSKSYYPAARKHDHVGNWTKN